MRTFSPRLPAAIGLAVIFACFSFTACKGEQKQSAATKTETKKAPAAAFEGGAAPSVVDAAISPERVATPEKAAEPEKKLVYRVYPDEHNPAEYVELAQLSFDCPEEIGRLFKDDVVRINPTLGNEREVPLERVKSLVFNKRGLVKPAIPGVGKLSEPVGYRDCEINLKNPEEKLTGILVVCRRLKGIKTDGAPWSANLVKKTGAQFHKIELLYR